MRRKPTARIRLRRVAALAFGISLSAAAAAQTPPAVPEPPPGADLPEIETIVPAEELEDAVPPLPPPPPESDPALLAPLETISEFEESLAPIGPVEGVPPRADPQLYEPLPPLEEFDVREIELAEPAPDQDSIELSYVTRIEGLESAEALAATDLHSRFRELSALREGDGEAANEAMLRARLAEDAELLRSLLEAHGWYGAAVTTAIERGKAGEPVVALLRAQPGERYSVGSIDVVADATVPPGLIDENFAVEVGDPIVAAEILAAEAALEVALPRNGYPFADVGQRDIVLDPETGLGDYTLPVEIGPRARFDGFETSGDLAFGVDHVRTIARFERGELYDSDMVDDLRQALIATGLFTTIAVEPVRTGIPAGDDTEYVKMRVIQHAGPPRTIAASAGYETGQGFRAQASWTHNNLFPPEGALSVMAIAGTQEQAARVAFRRSNAGKRDRTFLLSAEARRADFEAFEALTGRIAARLSYDSTPIWQKPFTWAIGAELIGTREEAFDPEFGDRRNRNYLVGGLTGEVGIDRTDSLLDPTRGFKAAALLQPEAALSDAVRPYFRAQIDASAYRPVGDGIVLAGRTRIGTIAGIDLFDLAPSRRFYAGGGGSVRGFGWQELGPRHPNGDPVGGRSVFELAGEVRYRFGDYGVVAFADSGQVYEASYPDFSDLRVGVGVGVRYYTNFGPLRVDIATPIDRRPGESRFNVYVSIGQAF